MTDNQIQVELTQAMAVGIQARVEEMQTKVAAGAGLVVVVLTREMFLRELNKYADTLHEDGTTEIHQIIRDVYDGLNAAADRFDYIAKESGQ